MKDRKKIRKITIIGGGGVLLAGFAALAFHLLYRMIAEAIGGTGWILDITIGLGMLLLMAGLSVWMLIYAARNHAVFS